MQQMTFMECVKRAWASSWEVVTRMPGLVFGTFVIYAALGWLALSGRPVPEAGDMPSAGLVLAGNLATLVNALVYLWFTLKVFRFVLLGELTIPLMAGGAKPLLRMLGLSVLLVLALLGAMVVFWLVLRPEHTGGIAFLVLVVVTIWVCVCIRLCLLSASLAIGGRIAIGAAWRDSRGHFWSLMNVSGVAALPLIACAVVVLIGLGIVGVTPEAVQTPGWFTALAIGESVVNIGFALVSSTAIAWLYRRYANELAAGNVSAG